MIRRSAKQIVRNELCAHQIWKVFAAGLLPSSTGTGSTHGDHQRGLISSSFGHYPGREELHPVKGSVDKIEGEFIQGVNHLELNNLSPIEKVELIITGIVKSTVPDVRVLSPGTEDVTHFLLRKERITEQFGVTDRRDHRWWIGSIKSSPVGGCHGAERSSSKWCTRKPGRSPDQGSSLLEPWNTCGTMRMLSTKPREGDGSSHIYPEEQETRTKEDVTARPKSIDDFQHEEIVGPTVERDESDTANQLRESLSELTTFMTNLRNGFVLLGCVQVLALLWSSAFHGVGFFVGLSQDFTVVMSFVFAYLLRVFGSRVEFFSKIEGRSRMKIITLSLQANRMLSLFFFRSTFVVKAIALCSLFAVLIDIWHSYFSNM